MSIIHGLPAHVLLVHVIVVLLPLSAALLVLSAVWPPAQRRLAGPNAVLSLFVVAMVPVTTGAGEWLQHHVPDSPLVRHHADLGGSAVWVALPVATLALVVWWRGREIDVAARREAELDDRLLADARGHLVEGGAAIKPAGMRTLTMPTAVTRAMTHERFMLRPASTRAGAVIALLSILAAGAATIDIYRIGDSGANAAWNNQFSTSNPHQPPTTPAK